MAETPFFSPEELQTWQEQLEMADRHNIFCHCRSCDAQWVDSSQETPCPECGSKNIEHICCWQFPDG